MTFAWHSILFQRDLLSCNETTQWRTRREEKKNTLALQTTSQSQTESALLSQWSVNIVYFSQVGRSLICLYKQLVPRHMWRAQSYLPSSSVPHCTADRLTDGTTSTMNWIVSHESTQVNQSNHFYQADSMDGLDYNIPGTHFLETRKTSMSRLGFEGASSHGRKLKI